MKAFNIALIPKSTSIQIVACANHFSGIADQYLLGNLSLPHVTLYQFKAEAEDVDEVVNKIKAVDIDRSIHLLFETFSCITFDNEIHWASLMPDKVDELNKMHQIIAKAIQQPVKPNYDPHMTLMSTKKRDYEVLVDLVKRDYVPIRDEFILSVGEADEVGQYLRVVYRF